MSEKLNILKDMIDDCDDFELLEGLDYYLKAMSKRDFPDEGISYLYDSYSDLVDILSDADERQAERERAEDIRQREQYFRDRGR